jgi:hypothetical protein
VNDAADEPYDYTQRCEEATHADELDPALGAKLQEEENNGWPRVRVAIWLI